MNSQQMNFVSRTLALANELRALRARIDAIEEEWFGNAHNTRITDLSSAFPHLDANELTAIVAALLAVRNVLVEQRNNLVKAVE